MASSSPEIPAVEPAPITREGLKNVSSPERHENFVRRAARSKLVDYSDPRMNDPAFFEVVVQTAFSQLKRRVSNVGLYDVVENHEDAFDSSWIEKGAALVAYIQLELRYEIFRALCVETFEEFKRGKE